MPSADRTVTVPNMLSASRLVLAAAFVAVESPRVRIALIVAAAITDFLDGWLARRSNATSRWGALLDPIADRVFVLTAVAVFLFTGELGTGQYFVLIMRDLATAVGFLVARAVPWLREVAFKARVLGKLVTVFQMLALTAVLAIPDAVPALLFMTFTLSILSIADYTLALWRARPARAVAIAALLALPAVAHAQEVPRARLVHPEVRADVVTGSASRAEAGGGFVARAGGYARVSLTGGIGARIGERSGPRGPTGRVDVVGRFILDPFRSARIGLSAGGGISAVALPGDRVRPYLLAVVDAEGRRRPAGWSPFAQLGLGAGVRIGGGLRWGRADSR